MARKEKAPPTPRRLALEAVLRGRWSTMDEVADRYRRACARSGRKYDMEQLMKALVDLKEEGRIAAHDKGLRRVS